MTPEWKKIPIVIDYFLQHAAIETPAAALEDTQAFLKAYEATLSLSSTQEEVALDMVNRIKSAIEKKGV